MVNINLGKNCKRDTEKNTLHQGCELGRFCIEFKFEFSLFYEFKFKFEFRIFIFASSSSSPAKIYQVLSSLEKKVIILSLAQVVLSKNNVAYCYVTVKSILKRMTFVMRLLELRSLHCCRLGLIYNSIEHEYFCACGT